MWTLITGGPRFVEGMDQPSPKGGPGHVQPPVGGIGTGEHPPETCMHRFMLVTDSTMLTKGTQIGRGGQKRHRYLRGEAPSEGVTSMMRGLKTGSKA